MRQVKCRSAAALLRNKRSLANSVFIWLLKGNLQFRAKCWSKVSAEQFFIAGGSVRPTPHWAAGGRRRLPPPSAGSSQRLFGVVRSFPMANKPFRNWLKSFLGSVPSSFRPLTVTTCLLAVTSRNHSLSYLSARPFCLKCN